MRAFPKAALALAAIALAASASLFFQPPSPTLAQGRGRGLFGGPNGVYKARVSPNWFDDNTKFWYRNDLRGGAREFILVDAVAGKRAPAFDHAKLAAAIAKAADTPVDADHLPFEAIEFADGGKSLLFTVNNVNWKCDLSSYALTKTNGPAVMGAPTKSSDDFLAQMERQDYAMRNDRSIFNDASTLEGVDDAFYASPQAGGGGGGGGRGAAGGGRGAGGGGRGGGAGGAGGQGRGGGRGFGGNATSATSADGKWTATVHDFNLFLRDADGKETQLSTDGTEDDAYTRVSFAPDSSAVIAFRLEPGDNKEVYRISSSPRGPNGENLLGGAGRAIPQTSVYPLPGDKFNSYELNVFGVADHKQSKPEFGRIDFGPEGGAPNPQLRWLSDGFHCLVEKYDRGHQRYRLVEVDSHTGGSRNVIDEQTKTFIWSAHREITNFMPTTFLRNENEILYYSEKDGWRHLYMVNEKTGEMKQLTKGDWVVRGIDYVDQDARQIWFNASGIYPDQDPYLIHYGRVNFDGTGLTWLTAGNGNHTITYSPDYKYIIDTYSRVDLAPMTELRRVSDGKLVTPLETADVEAAWDKPEVFVAKGRDDKTDIWGIIYRPANIDPGKKYAVIENIYSGPQGSFVPKTFSLAPRGSDAALVNLGFIVVHIDGMGTANRSKAFHDVCWQNLKDAGFLDRIKWIKAAAAKYSYMDLDRVGIFGTSAGGQNTAAAVLFHPEFYKVAVANSGCHDNRMDKSSWNEQWMGYPVGPQYSASSNIDNAYRLQGRLQLVLGELDTNVPVESTLRLVDALVQQGKDFEFVMIPGADHGAASPITQRKMNDFFVRYFLNTEPANHNLEPPIPLNRNLGGGRGAGAARGGRGGGGAAIGGARGGTGGNRGGGGGGGN